MPRNVIAIATQEDDGSITQRVWLVPAFVVELFAAQLGSPHIETVATAEQARGAKLADGVLIVNHLADGSA